METKKELSTFDKLSAINVNDKVEKKNGLTYLSWAWAWSEVKKACPNATYEIKETEYDEDLGFMCHTSVTIDGETLAMWLPVMDGANKSMKKKSYTYSTRYGDKTVEAATTFDINKTMMRCLVKNLAMFGFGIYIYAGEDLPEVETKPIPKAPEKKPTAKPTKTQLIELKVGDANWTKVLSFISNNKDKTVEQIVAQLNRKYSVSAETKKEIGNQLKAK